MKQWPAEHQLDNIHRWLQLGGLSNVRGYIEAEADSSAEHLE